MILYKVTCATQSKALSKVIKKKILTPKHDLSLTSYKGLYRLLSILQSLDVTMCCAHAR